MPYNVEIRERTVGGSICTQIWTFENEIDAQYFVEDYKPVELCEFVVGPIKCDD